MKSLFEISNSVIGHQQDMFKNKVHVYIWSKISIKKNEGSIY